SSGGAFLFDPMTQRELYRCALRYEQVALCVELARAARVAVVSQTPDELFFEGDLATWQEIRALSGVRDALADKGEAVLLRVPDVLLACPEPVKMTLCGTPASVVTIEETLRHRQAALHLTYSGPTYLEVTRAEASKGDAVKRLASHLGIALERILAI